MRRILMALTLCVGLLAAGTPTSATPTDLDSCPTDRPTLYDVTIGNRNVADFGSYGNVWALDSISSMSRCGSSVRSTTASASSTTHLTSFAAQPGGTERSARPHPPPP